TPLSARRRGESRGIKRSTLIENGLNALLHVFQCRWNILLTQESALIVDDERSLNAFREDFGALRDDGRQMGIGHFGNERLDVRVNGAAGEVFALTGEL